MSESMLRLSRLPRLNELLIAIINIFRLRESCSIIGNEWRLDRRIILDFLRTPLPIEEAMFPDLRIIKIDPRTNARLLRFGHQLADIVAGFSDNEYNTIITQQQSN